MSLLCCGSSTCEIVVHGCSCIISGTVAHESCAMQEFAGARVSARSASPAPLPSASGKAVDDFELDSPGVSYTSLVQSAEPCSFSVKVMCSALPST